MRTKIGESLTGDRKLTAEILGEDDFALVREEFPDTEEKIREIRIDKSELENLAELFGLEVTEK